MSTQKRIDQYFKSTSGNKGTNYGVKGSNRSRPSLSLSLKNRPGNGAKTPVGTSAAKKKIWGRSTFGMRGESYRESRTPERSVQSSIPALPVNIQRGDDKSVANIESSHVEVINVEEVTPPKKTIKSFAKACNSPTSSPSPGRMSLKRRENSRTELQSPPKRKLIYEDIITVDSQPEVIEIPIVSSSFQMGQLPIGHKDSVALPSTQNNSETRNDNVGANSSSKPTTTSSTPEDDFPDDFDPDIVEVSMEVTHKILAIDMSKKSRVDSLNNINGSSAPRTFEKNIKAKHERNVDLSNCGNSPSSSRWKLAATIQSPHKLMTALSSDWQSTLDVTKKQDEISNDCKDKIEKNNQEAIRQAINSSIKSAPRRALFSPPMTRNRAVHKTNINGSSNSPTKSNGSSNSPTKSNGSSNSPTKKPDRSPTSTPKQTPSSSHKASFTPRAKNSPQKMWKEPVDKNLATRVVENLNQAKQGVIPLNDFDLEAVYAKKSFELEYGSLNTRTAIKYEVEDVQAPEDKHANHFFMVLVNVFSEPMNCGYFDDDELDKIFSILTLSPMAQSLLVRMLKRKRRWHRVSAIQYPEIAPDLKPYFRELVQHGFLDDTFRNEEMSILLGLLQADEVKAVCQAMIINSTGRKPKLIEGLVKFAAKTNPLFPGMKTPTASLRDRVTSMLDSCIRLPQTVEDLLNRIFILFMPDQDPEETMVEAFNMLVLVHIGQKIFPPMPKIRFPIFRNRSHLICYAEARSALNHIINANKNKDWNEVRALGQLAYDRLQPYFASNDSEDEGELSTLPTHVKRFDANYAWIKVLSKSVDAFKKTKEGIDIAAQFLQALISRRNKIPGNRIRWYSELALIEMHHRKDLETSAKITIEALTRDSLTEIDAAEMLDRAKKILKRKQGISARTKERIIEAVERSPETFSIPSEPVVNEIEARMVEGNVIGSKSRWSVDRGTDVVYMTVEEVALHHYRQKGFRGLHCEGSLPITLFATLFWSEIYEVSVPGAFVSLYQDAPLDLYSSCFFDNRRERIEGKLKMFRALNSESLSELMHEDFIKYRHYQSLMHGGLFPNGDDFKDLVECLGQNGVLQICERLIGNYTQWKSGFPDLVVWNSGTKMCKIVEVKGPGDSLSTKQKLWIRFLESLSIPVEVCVVKNTTVKFRT